MCPQQQADARRTSTSAGLQHIRYVFVYPEQKDIVLVGPGEGWKVDDQRERRRRHHRPAGDVAGRSAGGASHGRTAAQGGITCSIDPTPEGLARLSQWRAPGRRSGRPSAESYEKALGMQRISVAGRAGTSHFARVLVAADYRMKRIAMNFDPSPVRGLPNYLQMVRPANAACSRRDSGWSRRTRPCCGMRRGWRSSCAPRA